MSLIKKGDRVYIFSLHRSHNWAFGEVVDSVSTKNYGRQHQVRTGPLADWYSEKSLAQLPTPKE